MVFSPSRRNTQYKDQSAMMFSFFNITPLGPPVAPLVYIIVQISFFLGGERPHFVFFPRNTNSCQEYTFTPTLSVASFWPFVMLSKLTKVFKYSAHLGKHFKIVGILLTCTKTSETSAWQIINSIASTPVSI
jgi:hypothetical protein